MNQYPLADLPGWEEEIQAQAEESARTQPIDMWGRSGQLPWR